jgi:carotenoid cleavage dioxygenase
MSVPRLDHQSKIFFSYANRFSRHPLHGHLQLPINQSPVLTRIMYNTKMDCLIGKCVKASLFLVILLAVGLQLLLRSSEFLRLVDKFLDSFQDIEDHLQDHFYLSGNYAPISEEHRNVHVSVVVGDLPKDLAGLFVRNGPNPVPGNITKRYHWFDGHGMLHNLRIKNGEAFYTNAYVPTPRYLLEKEAGEQIFLTIGSLTGISGLLKVFLLSRRLPQSLQLTQIQVGTANTNLLMYHNKFYCLQEASLPFEVQLSDRGDLFGVGYDSFDNALNFPFTAHPKKDFLTGNLVFFGYTSQPDLQKTEGALKVGEISGATGNLITYQAMNFPEKHLSFAHDIAFTKNWILVLDSSVHFNPASILKSGEDFFSMKKKANFRIGLFPRGRANVVPGDVIWVEFSEPLALIHILNSWEDADGIISLYAPLGKTFDLALDRKPKGNAFHMAEIRINPATKAMTIEWIDKQYNVEFPRVRDECLGRFCRYGYAGIMGKGEGQEDTMFAGFVKFDIELKRVHSVVRFRDGEFGGEPVLIPKPNSMDNEDPSSKVFIGNYVFNVNDQRSYFLLYDGETISPDPVTRLLMPYRIPYGFHGLWVEEAELNAHLNYHQALLRNPDTSEAIEA